jgi:hypothetical protein
MTRNNELSEVRVNSSLFSNLIQCFSRLNTKSPPANRRTLPDLMIGFIKFLEGLPAFPHFETPEVVKKKVDNPAKFLP